MICFECLGRTDMTPLCDFWYYGLRLRTDLPLTGLPRWSGEAGPADIEVLHGHVPERLHFPTWSNQELAVGTDNAALMTLRNVGRLIAGGGTTARISLCNADVSMLDVEGYLLAKVAGVLLHQRGVLLLHASSIVLGGQAVAFTGRSGAGKSTIAASLVRNGKRLLNDDITAIRFGPDDSPAAIPGSPHLRLRDDAAATIGISAAALHPQRSADGKRVWRRVLEETSTVPLAAVFRLATDPLCTTPHLELLRGTRAILPMGDVLYRFPLARRLGRTSSLAKQMLKMAQVIPIYRLTRPQHADTLPEILDLVQSTVMSNATTSEMRQ
jgi:hypothetical protein